MELPSEIKNHALYHEDAELNDVSKDDFERWASSEYRLCRHRQLGGSKVVHTFRLFVGFQILCASFNLDKAGTAHLFSGISSVLRCSAIGSRCGNVGVIESVRMVSACRDERERESDR